MFKFLTDRFARRKQTQVMVNLMDMYKARRPLAALGDVAKFTEEGYRRNSIVFACINLKATSFMGPELMAYQVKGEAEAELAGEHMLMQLLARPNGRDSQSQFFRKWSTCLDVAGNAYAYKLRAQTGMPLQLQLLRPDAIRPIPGDDGSIIAYQYGGQSHQGQYTEKELREGAGGRGPEGQVIPASDIIHEMAIPDPLDPYAGLSPIAVLARMGDLDNYAVDFLRSFFLNAGIPSGILKFKMETSPEQRRKARQDWRDRFAMRSWDKAASGGAFDVFVTDADVDYQEIGSKLKMMDLGQVFGETESRICGVFGVHPILVAAWIGLQRSTMANYEQARKSFYRDTLYPAWVGTADRFTVDLATEFGNNIVCKFDFSGVSELQESRSEEKKLALEAWDSGMLTKNEARAVWEHAPDSQGDVYKTKMAEVYEPAAVLEAKQSRALAGMEKQLLPVPGETHASGAPDWEQVKNIADRAAPAVKKKYSVQ